MSFELSPIQGADSTNFETNPALEVREALRQLPFVPGSALQIIVGRATDIQYGVEVPLDRIVGSERRMTSWAGDNAPLKRLEDDETTDSFSYAMAFAQNEGYKTAPQPVTVTVFADAAGEIWGRVEDGTHRVMAAKANGETTLVAHLKQPRNPAEIDRYPGDVMAEQAARH